MSAVPFIDAASVEGLFGWNDAIAAIERGHRGPAPRMDDLFIETANGNGLLNRAAWIEGIGLGLKSVSIFPANPSRTPSMPTVQGFFSLFDEGTGQPLALIDGPLITHWKTAADSLLATRLLARSDAKTLLIIGAGTLAGSLLDAYSHAMPGLEAIQVYARDRSKAEALVRGNTLASTVDDLDAAVGNADIISTATSATTPILFGAGVPEGCHVDLVGAYARHNREADDELLRRGSLFVDARETTIEHIGELATPVASGVIDASAVRGDLRELVAGGVGRRADAEITVFKNGGGAHLDLMIAGLIYERWNSARTPHTAR